MLKLPTGLLPGPRTYFHCTVYCSDPEWQEGVCSFLREPESSAYCALTEELEVLAGPTGTWVCVAQLLRGPQGRACSANVHSKNGQEHTRLPPSMPQSQPIRAKGEVTSGTGFEALQLQIHEAEGAYGCPF